MAEIIGRAQGKDKAVSRQAVSAKLRGALALTPGELVALAAKHRRWLTAAGVKIDGDGPVEISPLLALDAEELRRSLPQGARIAAPAFLSESKVLSQNTQA